MLGQRRHDEEPDTQVSAADEERIRQDERRRVLAELGADEAPSGAVAAGGGDGDGGDWRATPPPVDEVPVDDPHDPDRHDFDLGRREPVGDPRRWDVPDDREEQEEPSTVRVAPTAEVAAVRTAEVPVTEPAVVPDAPVVAAPAVVTDEAVVERGASPGQILIAIAGACALALGVVAVVRTGIERPLSEPVEPVLGWDHTALLGLIEIGAGAVMLLASLRAGLRWFGGLVGLAAVAGGILILAEVDGPVGRWITDDLRAERTFGWVAIAIGAAAVLGALVPRVRRTRARRVTTAPASHLGTS